MATTDNNLQNRPEDVIQFLADHVEMLEIAISAIHAGDWELVGRNTKYVSQGLHAFHARLHRENQ